MATPRRILMVCMGNICRSPTAEAVLRHKLKSAGLAGAFEVDSAGTHGHYHAGEPPDARALKHAAAGTAEAVVLRTGRIPSTGRPFLEVADRGVGIDPANAERIFEPFFTDKVGGTGLGLFISRELCQTNGALLATFGPEQLVMGTDYPFDMADYDPVGHIAGLEGIDEATFAALAGGNAARLLGI